MIDSSVGEVISFGDEFLEDPVIDQDQLLAEVSEDEQPEIEIYTDGHIVIGESAYEVDEVCEKLLRTLAKNPVGVERGELYEQFFGGYKEYTEPSPPQVVRFQEAVDYFASIEADSGTNLFTIFSREGDQDHLYFEPTFTAKYTRKPLNEIEKQPEEQEELLPDVLDDAQRKLVDVATELANHASGHEGRIYRKTLNLAMLGSEKPTFDQSVVINKTLDSLNSWLSRHRIDLELKSIVTPQGPAVQVSNIFELEGLTSEISRLEEQIAIDFENGRAQREAEAVIKRISGQKQKAPKRPTQLVQKEVTERVASPFVAAFNISPVLTEVDVAETDALANDIGIELSDALAARILLGRAIKDNALPTGKDEEKIVKLYQGVRARLEGLNEDESPNFDYQMWLDASFGVMILSYERRIGVTARNLAGGSYERYEELKLAGLRGLEDGMNRYSEANSNTRTYLPYRIYGEMVDYLRTTVEGPRDEEKQLNVTSLDQPTAISNFQSHGGEDLTLLDTLSIPDPSTEADIDVIEGGGIGGEIELVGNGLQRILDKEEFRSGNTEQDIRVTLFYFGIESLMTPEDLEFYRSLKEPEKEGIVLWKLGEVFGFTESRASQIVTKTISRLRDELGVVNL